MLTQNFQNLYELDINPSNTAHDEAQANFESIANGINTITPAQADTAATQTFYSDGGYQSTDITGKNPSWAIAGVRVPGDPVQDYIASLEYEKGDAVKALLRWTKTDGRRVLFLVTIQNIVTSGGAANANETFSCTLTNNGQPRVSSIPFVSSIVVTPASATVAVAATTQLTAAIQPSTAAAAGVTWTSSDDTIATVDSTGKVTGVAAGTVTITATAVDDSTKKATSTITVTAA